MIDLVLSLVLILFALVGFLFNLYVVVALLIAKQVCST